MLDSAEIKRLEKLCNETRQNVLSMIYNAQSGHIGGAFSAVELLTVLYQKCMKNTNKTLYYINRQFILL